MAESSYRARLEQLVASLEATPDIKVRRAEIAPPASDAQLATARTYAAFRLPAGVQEFYRELNGFHLEWEYTGEVPSGQGPDQGAIQLLPVERIFGSWKDAIWFEGFEGGDRFKPIKPFDFFQPEACAAFYQEPEKAPRNDVYFHQLGEAVCATGYSFTQYLDRLLAARGYLYWQLSLCHETRSNPEVRQFRERMPKLFKDFKPARFRPHSS